jgi:cytidylate kinase
MGHSEAELTSVTPTGYNEPMNERRLAQIAIDGPAGAGKSTVARRVAQELGYVYVDTGAMYRALAWAVLTQNVPPDDAGAVCLLAETLAVRLETGPVGPRVFVGDTEITGEIRTPEISRLTSPLSALPCVRHRLAALQREMGERGGVVMEGRDIGTVVLPQAEVKVFLTASLEERARRRKAELLGRGVTVSLEDLQRDIAERDMRDGSRDVAPMVPAADATILDSDRLDADGVVAAILRLAAEARLAHAR